MDPPQARITTGVSGLDDVLRGGFAAGRMYLVSGRPGCGKTLLGMHFLEAGIEDDETVLFVHGEESRAEIVANGRELGIDVSDAEYLDLGPGSDFFAEDQSYDLVKPSELDQDRHTRSIHETIRTVDPDRLVLDPITQLRYIEPNEYQYRKRILSFIRFLKEREITVLSTATLTGRGDNDAQIRSLSDGVIELEHDDDGRRLRVTKHRGFGQREGSHGMEIRDGGIEVFPSLVPERNERELTARQFSSGNDNLDDLLGGGVEEGTVTFISGPTGSGKTTTATQFLATAAAEGVNAIAYLFEEGVETFTHRSESIGTPVSSLREDGSLTVRSIEPLALSPEEFARTVQEDVASLDADLVLLDGISGYEVSIQGSKADLIESLHSLTRHLKNRDVTVFVTDEISTITGLGRATSSDLSYVADNITFLSYVERGGSLGKVIGILKKRAGQFDHSIRSFEITGDGIRVGDPMSDVSGILQGTPTTTEPPDIDE